ncbi:hypothetical protein Hanom_Chr16g01502021 [Helianthus anomalus]
MIWIPCCNGFCGVPLFRQACDGWIGRHPCCIGNENNCRRR